MSINAVNVRAENSARGSMLRKRKEAAIKCCGGKKQKKTGARLR